MKGANARISSVALVIKEDNPKALDLGRSIERWLVEKKVQAWVGMHAGGAFKASMPVVDLVLCLGGDGTFVSVARALVGEKIPLAGVNFGRVGFLAAISPDAWQESLLALVFDGIVAKPRMALGYRQYRNGALLRSGMVINDVVITRGECARLVTLDLCVNGAPLMVLRADGIILSTPTGSSGYARSSGGPLLFPSLNAYVVTAICPYLGTFPPLVIEPATQVSITAGKEGAHLYLNLDGQETHSMNPGDIVEVSGEPDAFRVVESNPDGYFEKLRSVGFI